MWIRILIAGLVGGVLVFAMGAISHAALGLQGRTIVNLPDEKILVEQVKGHHLKPGLYGFPGQPTSKNPQERQREFADVQKRFRAGPAGFLLIAPTGEEMMSGVFAWFSLSASYGIWYRFPHDFIHDEFYCAVLEWGVAGLAIAAIVKRPITPVATVQGTKHA